jgi:hypothetical protein
MNVTQARGLVIAGHLPLTVLTATRPDLALRVWGCDPAANRSAQWLFELTGTRELIVGLVACGIAGDEARRASFKVIAVSDAILSAAYLRSHHTGPARPFRRACVLMLGSALSAAAIRASQEVR